MPIYNPNGNEVSEIILPNGNTASQVIAPDGTTVFGADIPDSVVTRPADDNTFSNSGKLGSEIESDVEWPDIGARLSGNVASMTTAYIYRVSDGTKLGETDISNLSAGDTFVIEGVNLEPSTKYTFLVDAGGSSYTVGDFGDDPTYPYESSDGILRITAGAQGPQDTDSSNYKPYNMDQFGDVGF